MNRDLDGCYFRVKRGEKYESVCFSDLSPEEKDRVTDGQTVEWMKSLCYHLADRLKSIGDELDIVCG